MAAEDKAIRSVPYSYPFRLDTGPWVRGWERATHDAPRRPSKLRTVDFEQNGQRQTACVHAFRRWSPRTLSMALLAAFTRELYDSVEELKAQVLLRSQDETQEELKAVRAEQFVDASFGLPTVKDILSELEKPGRDPRPDFVTASFAEGVDSITDLRPGMLLEGTVTNVAAFGAFVDIGVHQDGLVHVSQLADRFVKDPHEVVKAGDVVNMVEDASATLITEAKLFLLGPLEGTIQCWLDHGRGSNTSGVVRE